VKKREILHEKLYCNLHLNEEICYHTVIRTIAEQSLSLHSNATTMKALQEEHNIFLYNYVTCIGSNLQYITFNVTEYSCMVTRYSGKISIFGVFSFESKGNRGTKETFKNAF